MALATFALLGVGGLVTSKGVGMSVPDWPTTYGYNMFFFPFSKWTGGVFYEHSHRLVASGVGLLTTILAVWLWFAESRRWLRWLGVFAFLAVVLQGVLGGLRVVLLKDEIGIFHAALAQLFFVLICAIALFTSRGWLARAVPGCQPGSAIRNGMLVTTLLILLQLILGATMRHQHAGLAISDFPLAYGKLWPATDAVSLQTYNARRIETTAANPITAFQIALQMAHRLNALAILIGAACVAAATRRSSNGAESGGDRRDGTAPDVSQAFSVRRLAFVWLGLILLQMGLGAWTVWSNKAADVATAHVLVGALTLATGAVGCILCFHQCARTVPDREEPVLEISGGHRLAEAFSSE